VLEATKELDELEARRELVDDMVDEDVDDAVEDAVEEVTDDGDGALLFGFGQRLKKSMMYGDTLIGAVP
jgi:hypothetical protein